MKIRPIVGSLAISFAISLDMTGVVRAQSAQPSEGSALPVTVDNFVRAESDQYFAGIQKESGGTGKFQHRREPARIDNQTVVRLNRDTLYSSALFDLEAGPVTVTLPDAGKRFMSMQVINEDHYVPEVVYGKGNHVLTKEKAGTRYVVVGIRTLVDPTNTKDIEQVHALQDGIKVAQKNAASFDKPNWDGNPDKDATYLNVTPAKNDGNIIYRLNVGEVPVDAFWSVSVYNADGYYEKNQYDAYTLNNLTAKKSDAGAIAIQFGGCDGKIQNCLPITKGWNYTVRLYRPRPEILNGKWKFPEPQPAS
jgi:hypothetical protein